MFANNVTCVCYTYAKMTSISYWISQNVTEDLPCTCICCTCIEILLEGGCDCGIVLKEFLSIII